MSGADMPDPWWDADGYVFDAVTGTEWRTRRIPVCPGRSPLVVRAETDEGGHTYVTVDVPVLPELSVVDARRLRVALDRAVRLVERVEGRGCP
ncbi:hypothetical protein [Actinomyces sp.]|uniref:hypothetical protein n=1 Tax=Actinomyces sp. TaxID=29317 RepID=UPI00289B7E59|nr:hypothetical protein [Actinomyces sp.]